MNTFFRKTTFLVIWLMCFSIFSVNTAHAVSVNSANRTLEYLEFRDIDRGTYNEYRYRITEKYFELRDSFQVNRNMDTSILQDLSTLVQKSYDYLPDNLENKNLYTQLQTDIRNALQTPWSDSTYNILIASMQNYVEDVSIQRMNGSIEVSPNEGNAPLNATLRANIVDPTWVDIPSYNYVWWSDTGSGRKVLWTKKYLNYTFNEEGNYSIFLWVKSNHKNVKGNSDVLPYYGKAEIRVKEKVASLIIKVNSQRLNNADELKFDSEVAKYWLLFDATSSTPNSWMKFTETNWDFWNGVVRKNSWSPRVEKVPYTTDGEYKVKLTLTTNTGKTITRDFSVLINHPAANIQSSRSEWYIGDKFTFSSKNRKIDEDAINYSWEIIDINNDEVIHTKNSNIFNYIFTKKWRYNVQLRITLPNGDQDTDTKIIYINSRPPQASFITRIPYPNRPNYVLLDGSRSFDPDISDEGKMRYEWTIDGERVELIDANSNGSVGYYYFDSIGQHSIGLEVTDPDEMWDVESGTIEIKSLLDVDFSSNPTAIQRNGTIRFQASSQNARFYEWDFWDGIKDYGSNKSISHTYEKSGSFVVTLTVTDEANNRNSVKKNVFVWKSNTPLSVFSMKKNSAENLEYDPSACAGRWAFIANKIDNINFDGKKSINLDGSNQWLTYSWKIWLNDYETNANPSYKFDELGCFPVKLTVVSDQNKSTHSTEKLIEVRNILPQLSTLTIDSSNDENDPIIFNIRAIGAKDPDGVIQSYLWYYYTDYDTEAQWFKTTPVPETSFVLPKITGTYFFWVVLKDNNEETFGSEDIWKFFRTVSSDQSDTPIIELKVNDNSLSINEEIVFTAKVKNIIGKDLSNSVEYYWDFDGDGFFEKKWTSPTVTYKYKKSGTFYPKLKVKYRGLSNVRNLTVDVSNKLMADFDYISVGNKFVFLDTSQGKIDSATWDFWDGTKSNIAWDVVHSYTGEKRVHTVKLTIREGTKTETVEKEVVANMRNILKARKTGLSLFSSPIIEDDVMKLTEEDEKITLYLWEANGRDQGEVAYYVVDYDIETDSDLNWGKDDDRDNINTSSYRNGTPLNIPVNGNKKQTVRVFTLDENEELINSYDFSIDKAYIVEETINLDDIVFEGVSEKEKKKIEELKSLLTDLPAWTRLQAMKYVQKLQEWWYDSRSKTDTMVEMQMFLSQIPEYDPTEVNELLESFLVDDSTDSWEKEVQFNALSNLIPQNISCEDKGESESCYEALIVKLENIKNSTNLEENKKLWSEVLETIGQQSKDVMSADSKLRFKEVLKPFVYGGISNVPEEELAEIEEPQADPTKKWLSILKWILYITAWILGLILLGLILFFIFYKLRNKDENVEFQDFIIEKTSGSSKNTQGEDGVITDPLNEKNSDDALANISFSETKNEKQQEVQEAWVKQKDTAIEDIDDPLNWVNTNSWTKKESKMMPDTSSQNPEVIPSWLGTPKKSTETAEQKSPTESVWTSKTKREKTVELRGKDQAPSSVGDTKPQAENKESIPDWLKWADLSSPKQKEEIVAQKTPEKKAETTSQTEKKQEDKGTNTDSQTSSKLSEEEANIPDWLKWAQFKKNDTPNKIAETQERKIEKKDTDSQKSSKTSKKDNDPKSENLSENNLEGVETKSENKNWVNSESKDQDVKSWENKKDTLKKNPKKSESSDQNQKDKKGNWSQKFVKDEELEDLTKLDDGIPDWLKWSLDTKKDTTKEKIEKKKDSKAKKPEQKQQTPQDQWWSKSLQETLLENTKASQKDKGSESSRWEKKNFENTTKDIKGADKDSKYESPKKQETPEIWEISVKKDSKTPQKWPSKKSKTSEEKGEEVLPASKDTTKKAQSSSKLKADAEASEKKDALWEWALWEDGMEIPDWLKWWDDDTK